MLHKGLVLFTGPTGSGKSTSLAAMIDHANKHRKDHIITIVILVGEMRDLETIRLAIEAAETGHLVLSTLHTTNAAKTVDRIIEVFPQEEQAQIRSALSTSLKLVVAQTLLKRVDKKGRCAALEIMVVTPAISNLIRENKTFQIPSAIQVGKQFGMHTLDDSIMEVLQKKLVSAEEAYSNCIDRAKFRPFLKSAPEEWGG